MKTLITLLAILLMSAVAEAQLGQSREELVKRYGESTGVGHGVATLFTKGDVTVGAKFIEGQALRIQFTKKGGFTSSEIDQILLANGFTSSHGKKSGTLKNAKGDEATISSGSVTITSVLYEAKKAAKGKIGF